MVCTPLQGTGQKDPDWAGVMIKEGFVMRNPDATGGEMADTVSGLKHHVDKRVHV